MFFFFIFLFLLHFTFFLLFFFYCSSFFIAGAIYITYTTFILPLSECSFSKNIATNTNSVYGNDIYFSASSNFYTAADIIDTCSDSLEPHFRGASDLVTYNISPCSESPHSFEECRIPTLNSCSDYFDNYSCNSKLSFGGLCGWIIDKNNNGGSCVYKSSILCTSYINEVQCISNSVGGDNCYYDVTDENGKCKSYLNKDGSDAGCSNSAHYEFDLSTKSWEEKDCEMRSVNSSNDDGKCGRENCVCVGGGCNTNPCYRENLDTEQCSEAYCNTDESGNGNSCVINNCINYSYSECLVHIITEKCIPSNSSLLSLFEKDIFVDLSQLSTFELIISLSHSSSTPQHSTSLSSPFPYIECQKSLECEEYSSDLMNYCSFVEGCVKINERCAPDPQCELDTPVEGVCNKKYCMYDDNEENDTYSQCIFDYCVGYNQLTYLEDKNCAYFDSVCKHAVYKPIDAGKMGVVTAVVAGGTAVIGGAGLLINKGGL
jgi:hypothetical protein